ncbi:MAG: hypothetical protein Sv326_0752 [Candidatus Fermentimicrarchaeum limneticum]|uniref:Uncharacterized protein n=1 Tax=Fermentimicrarchaeum limneticum TaxID=2795018 RepID=A0A7D5XPU9_FERL1|nr:MAG: hypothetical protein Sv326_0752 [Candidatus Fermentimicrarchaeum limneticum]
MAKQKKERMNRDFSYQDIVERLGEDDDVSFERIGDTIIMKREEKPEKRIPAQGERTEYYEEGMDFDKGREELDEAERKLALVKREIEKRKVGRMSRKDYEELDATFLRLESRLDSLDKEVRGLRVELGYLKGVVLDKIKETSAAAPVPQSTAQQVVEEVAVGKEEKQLQLVDDNVPEMRFDERKREGGSLSFLTTTLSNIYNSFFLGAGGGEEKDDYKEFQKKLFLLVRTQPRSLDEIAYGTEESKANCLIWLTRMVDEGLLAENEKGIDRKKVYGIVWEKIR